MNCPRSSSPSFPHPPIYEPTRRSSRMSVAPDPTMAKPTREQARPAHPRRWLGMGFLCLLILVGGSWWWLNRGGAAREGTHAEGSATASEAAPADLAIRVDVVHPKAGGLVRQT